MFSYFTFITDGYFSWIQMEAWLTILFFQQFENLTSFLLVTVVYDKKSAVTQNVLWLLSKPFLCLQFLTV